jgi:hypothetical protein
VFFTTLTNLSTSTDVVRARRYGYFDVVDERLSRVVFRPWPKITSIPDVLLFGEAWHRRRRGNWMRVYFNQPRRTPNFLAVTYVRSTRDCTYANSLVASRILDEIARIKTSDALVCDVGFSRISDRLLERWGWAPLAQQRFHRNYIKRFYGQYPPPLALPA